MAKLVKDIVNANACIIMNVGCRRSVYKLFTLDDFCSKQIDTYIIM